MQHVGKAQEFLLFALNKTRDRHTAPLGNNLGDLLGGNLFLEKFGLSLVDLEFFQLCLQLGNFSMAQLGELVEVVSALGFFKFDAGGVKFFANLAHAINGGFFFFPFCLEAGGLRAGVGELLAQSCETMLGGVVLFQLECGLLDFELEHAALERVEFLRSGIHLGADHRTRLVHEINGLVGQETVGNVAIGQGDRRDQCVVLNAHAMKKLKALANAAQDRDRVLNGRRLDEHRLETTL